MLHMSTWIINGNDDDDDDYDNDDDDVIEILNWRHVLCREWQMERSFQAAMSLHDPEVVFVLGEWQKFVQCLNFVVHS